MYINSVEVVTSKKFASYINLTCIMLDTILTDKTANRKFSNAEMMLVDCIETPSHWHIVNNPIKFIHL